MEDDASSNGISEVVASGVADLPGVYSALSEVPSPYGDGSASGRIVDEMAALVAGG